MNKETYKEIRNKPFVPHSTSFNRNQYEIIGWNTFEHRANETPDYPKDEYITPGFKYDTNLYACWKKMAIQVTFYDNPPCNVIYKVHSFGYTPTIKTTINGIVVNTTTVKIGEDIIVIPTTPGLNAKLEIVDMPDDCIFYILGSKNVSNQFEYVTRDSVINELLVFVILKTHDFDGVTDKIHEDKFIYSPGELIGGLRYTFHWQSQNSSDLPKEEIGSSGRIVLGHAGTFDGHKMHLSFGYQINNSSVQRMLVSYKNGGTYTGYMKNGTTFTKSSAQNDVNEIIVTGLAQNRTSFDIYDMTLDLTSYSYLDIIKFGIILKDHSTSCTGIYFGHNPGKTRCTVSIG